MLFVNLERVFLTFVATFLTWNLFLDEEYSLCLKIVDINFWMILLVLILYLIILSRRISYKFRLNLLIILLYYTFYLSNWVRFFILYEMVFIMTIFVIILIGYSFERLIAAYLILFYSFFFSSPILLVILLMNKNFFIKCWLVRRYFYCYFLVASFIVKFPIFGFHYWLPVAHVEASTVGSIILARLLLKLGGVGLFYVIYLLKFIVKLHWLSLGVLLTILIILNLRDLKIMIAYSSVAHIRITFYIFSIGAFVGKIGALMIMVYHGILSPLLFWIVGLLVWWKTRSLLVIKFLSFSSLFILIIFMLCILNIRFPPFLGFLREVLMLKCLITNQIILYTFCLRILFSCYYNIYFYWCFNTVANFIFKLQVARLDVFIFLFFVVMVNFY